MNYYAYVRVSSKDQNFERQVIEINKYCKENNIEDINFYIDTVSGATMNRPQYQEMRKKLRPNDVVIVKELDRLSRSKEDLQNEMKFFKEMGITFRALNIPTTLQDFDGQEWVKDMVNSILIEVLTTIAEEERIRIKQRQMEGIQALKKRNGGKGIGRPKKVLPKSKFLKYYNMWKEEDITATEFAKLMQVSRCSIYNYIKEYEENLNP